MGQLSACTYIIIVYDNLFRCYHFSHSHVIFFCYNYCSKLSQKNQVDFYISVFVFVGFCLFFDREVVRSGVIWYPTY